MLTSLEFRHCKLFVIWNLFIGISTWAISVHAETIRLKSGQIIEGTVVARTEDSVKINTGVGVPITYYLDEIENIPAMPQVETSETKITQPAGITSAPSPVDSPAPTPIAATHSPATAVLQTHQEPPAPSSASSVISQISHKIEEKFPLYTTTTDASLPPWQAPRLSPDEYLKIQAARARTIEQAHINHAVLSLIEYLTPHWRELKNKHPLIKTIAQSPLGLSSALGLWASVYALICFPIMLLSRRFKCGGWLAWVPVLQILQLLRIADKSSIWFLFFFFPVINVLAFLFVCMSIARRLERPYWLGYLMLIPGVNVLILWYLALLPASAPSKRQDDTDTGIRLE